MYALGAPGVGGAAMSASAPKPDSRRSELGEWLIAVADRRDRQAFARLFEHFTPRLMGFFARAGLSREAAEEVTQETMVSVWMKAGLYDPREAGVSTWIYTIARNARIDRQRREGRRTKLENEAAAQGEEGLDSSGEELVLVAEREQRVRKAIAVLPKEQAEVVNLSFFAERPHSEIARQLNLPLGTVKSRLRLAMSKIRAAWEVE